MIIWNFPFQTELTFKETTRDNVYNTAQMKKQKISKKSLVPVTERVREGRCPMHHNNPNNVTEKLAELRRESKLQNNTFQ